MSSRMRRLVGLLATAGGLLLLAQQPAAHAQRRPVATTKAVDVKEEEKTFTEAVTVPTNRESKQRIKAAQDYIKKKEWGTAAECLQLLLEDKQDSFIDVDGGPDEKGKPTKRRVSVRTEANRLIGELPPDGLETYQVKYGQMAADHLKAALEANDPALLAEVAVRFLHTKAGADATNLLGTYYLDRGEYLMANLSFERLLGRPDADKLPAKVLFKAALAARRAGDAGAAEKWWKKMADRAGRGELAFGARKVTIEQVRTEFEKVVLVGQTGQTDWLMFRGNPARNAQGVGGPAYLVSQWQYDVAPVNEFDPEQRETAAANKKIREFIHRAFIALEGKPVLPAFFPVSANGRLLVRTYDGVHAISLHGEETADGKKKAGEMIWESGAAGGLYKMVVTPGKRDTLQGWYDQFYSNQGTGPVGVFFENSTIGALSHDGQRVYFVDDLAVPPHPNMTQANFGNPVSYGGFSDQVNYSVLKAVEIDTGKLKWSIGGRNKNPGKDNKDDPAKEKIAGLEFLDTFFLGPPLPLGGKLYVLVEKNTEIRLVCLDPAKLVAYQSTDEQGQTRPDECPELVWQQSLGTAQERLPQNSSRRMQAVHLAYADGILVCPTNSGTVIGVDLLSHSLVWAHSYRDAAQPQATDDMPMRIRGFRGGFVAGGGPLTAERWRPSAPIIQNGKVVFTAYDGNELHCLNLRDGRLIWHVKRDDDDLYLAGVFGPRVVLVGKSYVRAVNLDDGKDLWKLTTGLPSGQGAASDSIYFLPLAWAAEDPEKKPAVMAINLVSGKPVGPPAKSRKKDQQLGNLIFVDGELISQTALAVAAFPELKRMLAEIDRRLKENPTDPIGLTERGELYLDKGELKLAVSDLRTALSNHPPAEVRGKARDKLHEALTDLLQRDFPSAEKYLDEYHDLCRIDIPAEADGPTKQRLADAQLRREASYLSLLGRGRENQGRLLDAFAAYEEFGALTGNKELVSVVDEPNTQSRPDVWSRGRIKGMLDRANPEQRKQLEAAIEKKWEAVRAGGDVDAIRRFVSVFGTHFKVGREAQLQLAERLLASGAPDDLTDAETKLQALCFSPDVRRQDPTTAARAIEVMIRIYLKRGLYEDAVGFYKQLGTEFANVPVRDGKTGADLLNELFTDKRFLPYLEPLGVTWKGALRTQDTHGNFQPNQMTLTIEPEGDHLLPFFQRHRVVLDMSFGGNQVWTLRLLDRSTGEEQWRQTGLQSAQYIINNQATPRYAFAAGHTLVLHLGSMVYAFNLAEHKKLWDYNLFGPNGVYTNVNPNMIGLDNDGRLFVAYQDGRQEKLGGVGLVSPSYVALITRDGLVALDPTRGGGAASKLWTKADVSMRAQLFGDDENVYVVEPAADGTPTRVRALRAQDGVTVPVPDFGRLYALKVRTDGRRLLVQEDDPQGGKALHLYDVQTGQDVWRRRFSPGAVVVQSLDPDLTGVIEKDNSVTLMNARSGAVLFKSLIQPEHVANLEGATLLDDHDHYYLALNHKADSGLSWGSAASFGIRSLSVNGPLYALNRGTGKLEWVCSFVPHQALLLEQVQDLPVLLFTSQYHKSSNGFDRSMVKVTGIDKQTGKLIYDREFNQHTPFHTLRIDHRAGRIDLVRQDLMIQLRLENGQAAKADPAAAEAVPLPIPGRGIILR